jgi:ABC-type transport system substrate-binding protein
VTRALAAGVCALAATLALASSGSPYVAKEGGTFRVTGGPDTIDPAFGAPDAACGSLMWYPDKPAPAGLLLRPELAEANPNVSRDGRTYTFTVRKDARFSDDRPVTAQAFKHALERILNPAMDADASSDFTAIVGAQEMLDKKAKTLDGAAARGRTLILQLTKRVPGFLESIAGLCAVPPTLSTDPEGAKAPLPSAAPYYAAEYVPGERLVLKRNRFYSGNRAHQVDGFVFSLSADPTLAVDDIESGKFDCCVERATDIAAHAAELAHRYGVNKPDGQYFVKPGAGLRMFVLNTSGQLFRNNPKLRQAVNFAVDRRALTDTLGAFVGTRTDQYLLPVMPGFRNEVIYPLKGPNLKKARALAKGHLRGGKAVLYAPDLLSRAAAAEIVKQDLKAIGLEVELVLQPPVVHFAKLATPGEPFDIGDVGYGTRKDPSFLDFLFNGRTIGETGSGNLSYFDSPKYNTLLAQASRLTGAERYRAYGELDVELSRDAAPAIPFAVINAVAFVSKRTGCVIMNPSLDLTAVCLK